jgi:hypothetical protein
MEFGLLDYGLQSFFENEKYIFIHAKNILLMTIT